ncbi:unnamed protein product [Somion occarium]|uniref:Thioesterase domain-containing protein n=1 Tax=Somion occarium TaxID=3059160 RepID=A0ABP1CWG4_9APHY
MTRTAGPNILSQTIRTAPGNISLEVREPFANAFEKLTNTPGYSHELAKKLQVVELSYYPSPHEAKKMEARAVCELTVDRGMVNDAQMLHGGCSAFLVDFCGSIVITLHQCHSRKDWGRHVSKTINMTYHAPAPIGAKLKIVNTTVSMGAQSRTMTSQTEIYDVTNGRLVASGTHVKMEPSGAKL